MSGQDSPFPTQMPQLALQHVFPPVQTFVPQGIGVPTPLSTGLAATTEAERTKQSQVTAASRRAAMVRVW